MGRPIRCSILIPEFLSLWLTCFCYAWKVNYCLKHYYCYCWNCYVFCHNFVTPPSNNCYCCLFVRRVKPRLNFFAYSKKQKKQKTASIFLFLFAAFYIAYLVLSLESLSSLTLPSSCLGGDFAFAKSIIIRFIWWLGHSKERWPSLPSSSPASSLPASSIPPAQKVPEMPVSWSAQKKKKRTTQMKGRNMPSSLWATEFCLYVSW